MGKQTKFYFKTGSLIFLISDRPCSKTLNFIKRHSQRIYDRRDYERHNFFQLLPHSYSVSNSADSRRSPANTAVLADTSIELTETVETVDSDLSEVLAGQGGNFFKITNFPHLTSIGDHWRWLVDINNPDRFPACVRDMVYDIFRYLDYPDMVCGGPFHSVSYRSYSRAAGMGFR